jgi:hypothetical protein
MPVRLALMTTLQTAGNKSLFASFSSEKEDSSCISRHERKNHSTAEFKEKTPAGSAG